MRPGRWALWLSLLGGALLLGTSLFAFLFPGLGSAHPLQWPDAGVLPAPVRLAAVRAPWLQTGITCTLATTTTDSLAGNESFASAAILSNYTGLALATGVKDAQVAPQKDYFRLDNAVPGYTYIVEAIPDGLGNYNLAIVVYNSSFTPILTDQNPFDGNSAKVSLLATTTGPYYFEISQYSAQCSGGTYRLSASAVGPTSTPTNTPTPTPTNTPLPSTAVPSPTWLGGYDAYEPNYDFDRASTIAPGVTYALNFIPWGGATVDNDYFKLWVKPGLVFSCETLELDPGVDTNMVLYNANREAIGGNDDRALGDYSSYLSFYSTYEGYLYLLVGQGGRMSLPDTIHSNYKLKCTMNAPGTPSATVSPPPQKDSTPMATTPPSSAPTPTPTSQPVGNQPLTFRLLTTPAPLTPTPPPGGFRSFRFLVYYDGNRDGQFGAGEGVAGFFVRVLSPETGGELARGYTDDQGQLSFTVPTVGSVRLLVPLLGLDRLVDPATPEVSLRIAPQPLPQVIP